MNLTTTHTLTFEVPTTRDYLKGGFGDLVAQCSCGAFEYVYSQLEGAYWHELHQSQPERHPHYLMLNAPMPEGWEPAVVEAPASAPVKTAPARTYTCPSCIGLGCVEAFGPQGGRFYHLGEHRTCGECGGCGRTERWAA